ncbi:MAG: TrkH family potassium uptake protein [Betaproteobacteria bacterium]|nr:TrkH family potassium uptake protein [Betaproteobacteria bacterium]
MGRFAVVLNLLSVVIVIFAATMLLPLVISVALSDGAERAYDVAIAATALAGILGWAATRGRTRELQLRDGFLLVVLVWTVVPAFATLPLMQVLPKLSFTDAYFETMAGITTTGSTVLSGLDRLPPSINLWRGQLQWLGGMGIIVLAIAIMPLLGVGGSQLFKAETPGPMKDTKLTPRITETAKGLWLVYFGITVACALAFRWAGMEWLDAVIHAFSTLSLGGFSSHDASFGHWNSQRVEAVAIFFMLVAGINFGTHFLAWRKLSLRPYRSDPEAFLFLAVTILSCLGIAWYLLGNQVYPDYGTALRFAAFNVVSIATTTGYANTDFNLWPIFAPLWMLFLCSFSTCAGSTGGGMKMIRAQILFKQIFRELLRIIHPRLYNPVKLAGQPVENNVVFAVLAFAFVYVSCIILMTLLLAGSGLDVVTAFSAVVVCINNTGPGLNQVGPATTFEVLNDFQTWVLTFAMVLGRLELMTLLVVLTPAFWRK